MLLILSGPEYCEFIHGITKFCPREAKVLQFVAEGPEAFSGASGALTIQRSEFDQLSSTITARLDWFSHFFVFFAQELASLLLMSNLIVVHGASGHLGRDIVDVLLAKGYSASNIGMIIPF